MTICDRRNLPRALASVLLVVVLILGAFANDAAAQDAEAARCHCVHREGCYHFRNAPVAPPDDPCPCERCETESRHVAGHEVPKGFNAACMASNRPNGEDLHRRSCVPEGAVLHAAVCRSMPLPARSKA